GHRARPQRRAPLQRLAGLLPPARHRRGRLPRPRARRRLRAQRVRPVQRGRQRLGVVRGRGARRGRGLLRPGRRRGAAPAQRRLVPLPRVLLRPLPHPGADVCAGRHDGRERRLSSGTIMSRRPNVVFVLADDMGYGDLGHFNDGRCSSPHLDRIASEGLCLTQHYSGSPVCAPARAALLTGRYPHRTGAIDTLHGRGLDRIALDEVTIADAFRAAGYRTGLVGKWHNGALDSRYHPNARGFEEFVGFSGGWADYYDYQLDLNGSTRASDGRYLTDVLGDYAVDFIRRHRAEPFFLLLAFNA